MILLSYREREGPAPQEWEGEGDFRRRVVTLILPALCASLPLPTGEGI